MVADPIQRIYERRRLENIKALSSYKAPRPNFRASEVRTCVRQVYFRLAGYIPKASDPRLDDYGVDGDYNHDMVRDFLVRYGVKIMGVRFEKDGTQTETMNKVVEYVFNGIKFKVAARLDGVIRIGGVKHILEIKSKGFWKLKPFLEAFSGGGGEIAVRGALQREAPEHQAQLNLCMDMFGIHQGYLVFKDRSECAIGLHERNHADRVLGGVVYDFDAKLHTTTLRRFSNIQRALELTAAPEPEYLDGSKPCTLCDFYHMCHGADRRRAQGKEPHAWHPQLGDVLHVEEL